MSAAPPANRPVVFDLLGFQNREHGERGIARYILNLALAIERGHPDFVDHYLVHAHLPIPEGIEPLIASGKVVRDDRIDRSIDRGSGGLFIAGSLFELQEPLASVLPGWARGPGWSTATVLYDLIPLRFDHWYLQNPVLRYQYEARVAALAAVDHLLSISDASSSDASELLGIPPERLTTIYAGADRRFSPPTVAPATLIDRLSCRVEGLEPGFVMFPSGIEIRKNIDRMLEAYATIDRDLRAAHQLVLVCRTNPDEQAHLEATARRLGIHDRLLVTGFVSDDDLVALYQSAHLVVFPSLYEGFGLPVLEAMQCGAPVICSDTSSLIEVQTDPRARFDPTDTASITEALRNALRSDEWLDELRSQPPEAFSWERSASVTVAALTPLASRAPAAGRRRPTLALVTPLPPQASGIANYAARLLEHLTAHFDITAFVDEDPPTFDPIEGVELEALSSLPRLIEGGRIFDHVLYFIGNSSFHVEALDMLSRVPGHVLLHDVRLTGLYSEVQRLHPTRLPWGSVGAKLETLYPQRYRRSVVAEGAIWPSTAARFGIMMATEVVAGAQRVMVHSRYAASLVELDTGHRPIVAFDIPAMPAEPTPLDRRTPNLIVSFGIVAPIKMPERIIDAFAIVAEQLPDAELVFVGGVDEAYRDQLDDYIDHLPGRPTISFTDHADPALYDHYLHSARLAVQLRKATNGESSGTLAETTAVGLPTIVSNIGAQTEFDDRAALKVDIDVPAQQLAAAIVDLLTDEERATATARAGLDHARRSSYEAAAKRLAEVLTEYRPVD